MNDKELKKKLSEARKNREYGQFADSLATLHEINNEYPDNVQYRYLLAVTYYENWNTDAALKYAEEALKLDPAHKETYELLGDIFEKQKDTETAKGYYEKALEIDPQYLFVEEKLIKIYFKTADYEKAVRVCDNLMNHVPLDKSTAKARSLTSVYLGTKLYKGFGLVFLKRYEEAIAEMLDLRKLNTALGLPEYPGQYRDNDESIFKMYYRMGNHDQAGSYLEVLKKEYNLSQEEIETLYDDAKNELIITWQKYDLI